MEPKSNKAVIEPIERIISGRVHGKPETPGFPLSGFRVVLLGHDGAPAWTDVNGRFVFVGAELPGKGEFAVYRGDELIGRGAFSVTDDDAGQMIVVDTPRPQPQTYLGEPVVSERLEDTLFHALSRAMAAGLAIEGTDAQVLAAIGDLRVLESTARQALIDQESAARFLYLLKDERPWPDESLPGSKTQSLDLQPVIWVPSPGAPLLAAWVTSDGNREMVARSINAYLRRVEPLTRLIRGATALATERISLKGFAHVVTWALPLLSPEGGKMPLLESLATGPTIFPLGGPEVPTSDDLPSGFPTRPPIGQFLDPSNQPWLECALNVKSAFKPLPKFPQTTPLSHIQPTAICAASAMADVTIKILPDAGLLPDQNDWGIAVPGHSVTIVNWSPQEIEATISGPITPGCTRVEWVWKGAGAWTPPVGAFDACSEALRLPFFDLAGRLSAVIGSRTRRWQPAGLLTVVAPRVGAFMANGTAANPNGPTITVKGCSDVTLSWSVDPMFCPGSSATAVVSLMKGGAVVETNLPLQGTRVVNERTDATYTLNVTGKDGSGAACSTQTSTPLTVGRFLTLSLSGLPLMMAGGTTVQATVQASCPAPVGGLLVSLASLPPGRLIVPASITILAGQQEAAFAITSAADCGPAGVTASEPGHSSGSQNTCVLMPPKIVSGLPAPTVSECESAIMKLNVSCIGNAPTVRLISSTMSAVAPKRLSVTGSPGTCVGSAMVEIEFTTLTAGAYALELTDHGVTLTVPNALTVTVPVPLVDKVSPSSAQMTPWVCPAPIIKLKVKVTSATNVTASPDMGGKVVTKMTSSNCGTETVDLEVPVDASTTRIEVTASRGGVSTVAVAIPVSLDFTNWFMAVRLRNSSAYMLKISSSKVEQDPVTGKEKRTPRSDIILAQVGPGGVPTQSIVTLSQCETVSFTVRQTVAQRETVVPGYEDVVVRGHPNGTVFDVLI